MKAITAKFVPTRQFFYSDCSEVIPDLPEKEEEWQKFITTLDTKPKKHRTDGVRAVIGGETLSRVQSARLFMIGCGAIGCELLKNYAMISLGTSEESTSKDG